MESAINYIKLDKHNVRHVLYAHKMLWNVTKQKTTFNFDGYAQAKRYFKFWNLRSRKHPGISFRSIFGHNVAADGYSL
jgi:hypothetical protein